MITAKTKLNITSGNWHVHKVDSFLTKRNEPNKERQIGTSHVDSAVSVWGDDAEAEANTNFICEAANVYQECGLTPKELLKQRDELLNALREIVMSYRMCVKKADNSEYVIEAEKAIANATRK